jgi:carbonic anhydrase
MAVAEKNATFPGSIGRVVEPILPAVLEARRSAGDPFEAAVRQSVRKGCEAA